MAGSIGLTVEFCSISWGSIIGEAIGACFPLTNIFADFVGGGLGEYFHGLMEMIWVMFEP